MQIKICSIPDTGLSKVFFPSAPQSPTLALRRRKSNWQNQKLYQISSCMHSEVLMIPGWMMKKGRGGGRGGHRRGHRCGTADCWSPQGLPTQQPLKDYFLVSLFEISPRTMSSRREDGLLPESQPDFQNDCKEYFRTLFWCCWWASTLLYHVSLLSGCWDDHYRNPNINTEII